MSNSSISSRQKEIEKSTGDLYASIWDNFWTESHNDTSSWEDFALASMVEWEPLPVAEDFFENKRCLDAGTGMGRAARYFAQQGANEVIALDVSPDCLRNAKVRNSDLGDKIKYVESSVLNIPYPDRSFDFVHCDGVIHHTVDPLRAFSELVRVTKPGGHLVLGVLGKGGLMGVTIGTARLFRHIIPINFIKFIIKLVTRDPLFVLSVIDPMYVPIRETYREPDVMNWFFQSDFAEIKRTPFVLGPYKFGRWMRGEGFIKVIGQKKG